MMNYMEKRSITIFISSLPLALISRLLILIKKKCQKYKGIFKGKLICSFDNKSSFFKNSFIDFTITMNYDARVSSSTIVIHISQFPDKWNLKMKNKLSRKSLVVISRISQQQLFFASLWTHLKWQIFSLQIDNNNIINDNSNNNFMIHIFISL